MLIKKYFSLKEMALWTRSDTIIFIILAIIPTVAYDIFGQTWIGLPWTPIALVGTAVAFVVGFRNNAVYGRLWEARKIWGGIVNDSRTFSIHVGDMVTNEYAKEGEELSEQELFLEKQAIVRRHMAWLTALRYAMRTKKTWESFMDHHTNREWANKIHIPEFVIEERDALSEYLSKEELDFVMRVGGNKAASIIKLQSRHLRKLKEKGLIWEFSFLHLESIIRTLLELQGKSERIKNFPYPRQYATLNVYFVWAFIIILPLGIVPEFARLGENMMSNFPLIGDYFIWFSVPFTTLVSWVFHTMERIGTVGENPFEGSANDVPISTIARAIEIDVLTCVGDPNIPEPFEVKENVQM
ncbi:hypothetical protein KMW28_08475 [Flammeovirga yaeyamensis]|uniref:Uncharacterized protein n=2 Tax=Flammeovirga yaeyamensis TaxID=367791 RepID=A0AAX1N8P3_9BACT|nr:bestrophin family ion channel [Flammeovirga yaeyamensis]MBB3699004.1 putative membrane protein [Flammeovirga yaeyamensis]NMF36438.1 hypothetical protein [Flammeovirga yaeyamensis]QWG03602.1 hypothetical protein KMW28_08475 [Flammeovirga yaeyamensis]